MAIGVRSILIILAMLASMTLVHSPITITARSSAPVLSQPLGPVVHRTIRLFGGTSSGWNGSGPNPGPLITANDGDNVTISLRNSAGDSATHSWYLDFNDNLAVDPNEVVTRSQDFSSQSIWTNFTLVVGLGTVIPHGGLFTYRCAQHPGPMYGSFKFYAGPVASFNHSPMTPLVGHPVSFDASASWPSTDANINGYRWSFGDGNTTSTAGSTIAHTYATNNTYTVILNITDTATQNGTISGTVTVLNPPPIPFDYNISISSSTVTIIQGKSGGVNVTLGLVSGVGENVNLSSDVFPSQGISVSLTPASGFPTYSALMNLTSLMSAPTGDYTVTVMALSSTGVAHNATFVLVVKPPIRADGVQTPNYVLFTIVGAITVVGVLAVLLLIRRARNKRAAALPY